MSFFSASTNMTPATLPDVGLDLIGSATVRGGLCEYVISSDATPNEYMGRYRIQRFTASGTGTVTPPTAQKNNPLGPAAQCTIKHGTFSIDPTLTADTFYADHGVHQKATYRWIAHPGREIYTALAVDAGLAVPVITAQSTAFTISVTMGWLE